MSELSQIQHSIRVLRALAADVGTQPLAKIILESVIDRLIAVSEVEKAPHAPEPTDDEEEDSSDDYDDEEEAPAHKPWSDEDDKVIRHHMAKHAKPDARRGVIGSARDVAHELGRTINSVSSRFYTLLNESPEFLLNAPTTPDGRPATRTFWTPEMEVELNLCMAFKGPGPDAVALAQFADKHDITLAAARTRWVKVVRPANMAKAAKMAQDVRAQGHVVTSPTTPAV